MTENSICKRLRDVLVDHQIELPRIKNRLHDARRTQENLETQIGELENQIRQAELQSQIGRSAPRAFGPAGAAATVLTNLEAEIRRSRLTDKLTNAKRNLGQSIARIAKLEERERGHSFGIGLTQDELQREGCNSR